MKKKSVDGNRKEVGPARIGGDVVSRKLDAVRKFAEENPGEDILGATKKLQHDFKKFGGLTGKQHTQLNMAIDNFDIEVDANGNNN